MNWDELERIYEGVWREEDGAKRRDSADGWNGSAVRDGSSRKRRRNSWRLLKQVIPPRGVVRYENSVFRIEERQGQFFITPKHRFVRITARGRKFAEEAREIPVMTYEEFFERFLRYSFDATTVNGRVSGVQRKFLESIVQEGVLPCTGDLRRC